jgi:hypothetical protein
VRVFGNQIERDIQYLMEKFQEQANQCLVSPLASLMRDGLLHRTMQKFLAGSQPTELGRKLPAKLKYLKSLPPRVWHRRWEETWLVKPYETDEPLELTHADNIALASWALSVNEGTALVPREHKGSDFEGPLLHILKLRAVSIGRITGMTPAKFMDGQASYFQLPNEFIGEVDTYLGTKVRVVDAAKAKETDDWDIYNGHLPDATLGSESLGWQQHIWVVWQRSGGPEKAMHDDVIEMPRACDHFPTPKGFADAVDDIQLPIVLDVATPPRSTGRDSSGLEPAVPVENVIPIAPREVEESVPLPLEE